MNSYPEPRDDSDPELAPVVYEQPLNERMRTFLRLEFLYTQATYHSELENPCQLLRVTMPPPSELFPEISGSQHRCTIRFLNWTDATSRPVHVEMDVPFLLTCCS